MSQDKYHKCTENSNGQRYHVKGVSANGTFMTIALRKLKDLLKESARIKIIIKEYFQVVHLAFSQVVSSSIPLLPEWLLEIRGG